MPRRPTPYTMLEELPIEWKEQIRHLATDPDGYKMRESDIGKELHVPREKIPVRIRHNRLQYYVSMNTCMLMTKAGNDSIMEGRGLYIEFGCNYDREAQNPLEYGVETMVQCMLDQTKKTVWKMIVGEFLSEQNAPGLIARFAASNENSKGVDWRKDNERRCACIFDTHAVQVYTKDRFPTDPLYYDRGYEEWHNVFESGEDQSDVYDLHTWYEDDFKLCIRIYITACSHSRVEESFVKDSKRNLWHAHCSIPLPMDVDKMKAFLHGNHGRMGEKSHARHLAGDTMSMIFLAMKTKTCSKNEILQFIEFLKDQTEEGVKKREEYLQMFHGLRGTLQDVVDASTQLCLSCNRLLISDVARARADPA